VPAGYPAWLAWDNSEFRALLIALSILLYAVLFLCVLAYYGYRSQKKAATVSTAAAPTTQKALQDNFVPIHRAIAHIAQQIDDCAEKDGFLETRTKLRQHASDGRIRVRGRKQIDSGDSGPSWKFSDVETDIPKDYWANSIFNHLATDLLNKDSDHTMPESIYAWGPNGIFERKRYAELRVDWSEIL
jgi:hypothetical protein